MMRIVMSSGRWFSKEMLQRRRNHLNPPYNKDSTKGEQMVVYVGPDTDTSMVNSEVVMMTREELDALDNYIMDNDYEDDVM